MYRFIFFYSLNQVGGIILEISVYFGNDRSERTECCCRTDKNRFRVNWGENIYIYSPALKNHFPLETFRFERYTVFVAPIKIDLLHVRFANQLPFPPPIDL